MRLAVFFFALLLAAPIGASQETKLLAADPAAGRQLGFSVAIDGDVAAIGAPFDSNWAGAVYVFRRIAGVWVQEQKLVVSAPDLGDQLGFWVDVSGDLIAASAPSLPLGIHSGRVYVFRYNGNTWIREDVLTASDGVPGDDLGLQVAARGNVIVATATNHADATGAAYVFRFDGSSWGEEVKLQASDATANDFFGGGLALEDDVVVVGAERENGQGAAYVFRRSAGVWQEEEKVVPAIRTNGDEFGHSVEIDGDELVVGAPFRAGGGSAYAFRRRAGVWTEIQVLQPPEAEEGDEFGRHVGRGLAGDYLAVGASGDDDLGADAGAVYLFARQAGRWQPAGKRFAPDGSAGAWFGWVLELAAEELLVGSPHDSEAGAEAGAAYVLPVVAACADGIDNDGDGRIDFDPVTFANPGDETTPPSGSGDPGCNHPTSVTESPRCQDGINNDLGQDPDPGLIDYDGGQLIWGACTGVPGGCPANVSDPEGDGVANPDPQCAGTPWKIQERRPYYCGLGGFELVLILPGVMWLHRRRRWLH